MKRGPQRAAFLLALVAREGSRSMRELILAAKDDPALIHLLAETAQETDPAGFVRHYTDIAMPTVESYEGRILREFTKVWSVRDPEAAVPVCLALEGEIRNSLGGAALQNLLNKDATAALKLAKDYPTLIYSDRYPLLIPATEENLALVKDMPPCRGKLQFMRSIATGLAPDQAFALAESDPVMDTGQAYNYVARSIALRDPAEAEEWYARHPHHSAVRGLAGAMGNRLLESDPAAALSWFTRLHGPGREDMIRQAIEQLEPIDPAAAEAGRDHLKESFVRTKTSP